MAGFSIVGGITFGPGISFNAEQFISTSYLVVAGGGSGGIGIIAGGGGGAGGVTYGTVNIPLSNTLTINVGLGGNAIVNTTPATAFSGINGGNSNITGTGFTTIPAVGGGGGG